MGQRKQVGSHRGGYTPFTFDITAALKEGENELVVRCFDNGKDPLQYTGKQIYFNYYNKSCYYTRCTGIWQTVWLEYVPKNYIENLKLTPDVDNGKIDITVRLAENAGAGEKATAMVSFKGDCRFHGNRGCHRKDLHLQREDPEREALEPGGAESLRYAGNL